MIIATLKTSAADLVTQCVIERKSLKEVDWKRNMALSLEPLVLGFPCKGHIVSLAMFSDFHNFLCRPNASFPGLLSLWRCILGSLPVA